MTHPRSVARRPARRHCSTTGRARVRRAAMITAPSPPRAATAAAPHPSAGSATRRARPEQDGRERGGRGPADERAGGQGDDDEGHGLGQPEGDGAQPPLPAQLGQGDLRAAGVDGIGDGQEEQQPRQRQELGGDEHDGHRQ